MNDPIYCTGCWNGDCELHPSVSLTDDSNTVGPAIKAYTIQEKRHEKELTKFKTERAALEKRCELQLETIRDLRLQLDLVTEDRQVEIETRQRLQAELTRTQNTLKAWQSCTDCWNGDECERHPRKNDDDRQVTSENEQLKQVTSEHTREVHRLQAEVKECEDWVTKRDDENERLERERVSATKERDELSAEVEQLRAELSKQRNIGSDWEREAFKLRRVVDGMGADLDHAIAHYKHAVEVKNRCVASVNRLCSQVVELQAQLKGKE